VDSLQGSTNTSFEDTRNRFSCISYSGFFFEERDKRVLAVASDEEGIVAGELFAESGEAVFDRFCGVVFVVDALGAGGGGEVLVSCLLAVVSCWVGVVSGAE